jgi:hypothetical protein
MMWQASPQCPSLPWLVPQPRGFPRGMTAKPSQTEIVLRAYELWEQAGKPDEEFYLQALHELQKALDKAAPRSR